MILYIYYHLIGCINIVVKCFRFCLMLISNYYFLVLSNSFKSFLTFLEKINISQPYMLFLSKMVLNKTDIF